jgi:hypothetical protein
MFWGNDEEGGHSKKNPFVQIFKIWPPEGKLGGFKIFI